VPVHTNSFGAPLVADVFADELDHLLTHAAQLAKFCVPRFPFAWHHSDRVRCNVGKNSTRRAARRTAASFLLLVAIVGPAIGRDLSPQARPDEANLDRHGYYTNISRHQVHQPAKSLNGNTPSGASAQCRDGDYSFSEHHSGTCSRHGGVDKWLR
jgi:hypothetical protein